MSPDGAADSELSALSEHGLFLGGRGSRWDTIQQSRDKEAQLGPAALAALNCCRKRTLQIQRVRATYPCRPTLEIWFPNLK